MGHETPSYLSDLVRTVATRDGVAVTLRPIRPGDAEALVTFHEGVSPNTAYLRFFGAHPRLSHEEVERFAVVDYADRLALVAEVDGELIGVARYDRLAQKDEAEVAFVVTDAFQHRGVGTLLLELLAEAGLARGITTFVAQTLAVNQEMFDVFANSGFPVQSHREGDVVYVRFSIVPDAHYRQAVASRHGLRPGSGAGASGTGETTGEAC